MTIPSLFSALLAPPFARIRFIGSFCCATVSTVTRVMIVMVAWRYNRISLSRPDLPDMTWEVTSTGRCKRTLDGRRASRNSQ